jgi:Family of unknown function (DUF6226)
VHTPGWADPHPDRRPNEEEYSRCLDPGKYRILDARVDAWTQVLSKRGIATSYDMAPTHRAWTGAPRDPQHLLRVLRLDPAAVGGLSLLLATTIVDGAPFGLDIGVVGRASDAVFLETIPDCGCDACDSGSADLLETLDGWVLTVARGAVIHARDANGYSTTRTIDGWQGHGDIIDDSWLDEAQPAPDGVHQWAGTSWL